VEDLIRDIQEKTGLSADKVLEVVTMVTDYMKSVLPDELVAQAQAATTAATAVGTVLSAVSDVLQKPDDE